LKGIIEDKKEQFRVKLFGRTKKMKGLKKIFKIKSKEKGIY